MRWREERRGGKIEEWGQEERRWKKGEKRRGDGGEDRRVREMEARGKRE